MTSGAPTAIRIETGMIAAPPNNGRQRTAQRAAANAER